MNQSADALPLAELCELCQQIFEGQWMEKELLELATGSNATNRAGDPGECLEQNRVDNISSQTDTASFSVEGWYENPDWVKVMVADTEIGNAASLENVSFLSPQHHTIAELEQSARNGCNLCRTLVDIVRDKTHELEEPIKKVLPQLLGIVIVRPYNNVGDNQESIVLEISYFIDGKVEQETYGFSVDILLLPCQSML